MYKLIIVLFVSSFFISSSTAQPISLPGFLRNWIDKIKNFFKNPELAFQLQTFSGFICNVTEAPEYRIEQIGSHLIVDIPVAILLKTINYISCKSASTGRSSGREEVESQLIQHRGEALKMRLLNNNGETPLFVAEKFVEVPPNSAANHHQTKTTFYLISAAVCVTYIVKGYL